MKGASPPRIRAELTTDLLSSRAQRGTFDFVTEPRTTLCREVLEETGLVVDVGIPLGEHLFEVLPGRFVHIVAFACHLITDAEAALSAEHLDVRWLSLDQVGGGMIEGHRLPEGYLAAVKHAARRT